MTKINHSLNGHTERKQVFSKFVIEHMINDKEKVIFYIIPTAQEEKFLVNSGIVDTSLDAKEFYQINSDLYSADPEKYDDGFTQFKYQELISLIRPFSLLLPFCNNAQKIISNGILRPKSNILINIGLHKALN